MSQLKEKIAESIEVHFTDGDTIGILGTSANFAWEGILKNTDYPFKLLSGYYYGDGFTAPLDTIKD